jgi:outer membrane protein assembly factor BamB
MYRHDAARSGTTDAAVPTDLKQAWQVGIGGKLSSLVAADGKVLVAQVDAHMVHALDAESGKRLWSCTAGGRVDSPPTLYDGRVLFGCADGWVYCLRIADGALAWRFRAAPTDRRIVSHGRIESVWPVHGSVLVDDGVAYFTAGRSSYLDGGMYLYRIDAETGKGLSETRLDSCDPVTGGQREEDIEGLEMAGKLPDVLSTDGQFVFLRDAVFDREGVEQEREVRHLYCPQGFLDDTWWHRTYWMYGTHFYSGAGGWPRAGREFPSGRILVCDDSTVYGFGRRREYYRWTTPNEYHLFATDKIPQRATPPKGQAKKRRGVPPWQPRWSKTMPLHARAMVLAAGTLFVAGPPDVADEATPGAFMLHNPLTAAQAEEALAAWQGKRGALLWAVSATDGNRLAEFQLEHPPVWDGMIAADGCLFVSSTDGTVLCLKE